MKAKKVIVAFSVVLLLLSLFLGLYLVTQNQDIRSKAADNICTAASWAPGCRNPTKTPTPIPKTPTPQITNTPVPDCPTLPPVSDLEIVCPRCQL